MQPYFILLLLYSVVTCSPRLFSPTQTIRLQSFARRWLAQQEVARLRRDRDRRLAWLELQEKKRKEEKEEQLRDRRHRWMNPQRREDFNLLYHALESRLRVTRSHSVVKLMLTSNMF